MKNYIEWVITEDDNNFSSELRKKFNKIKKPVTGEIYQIDWNDKANHDLYKKITERGTGDIKEFTKAVMRMLRLFLKFSNNIVDYYEYGGRLTPDERTKIANGSSKLLLFRNDISKKRKLLSRTYFITMRKSNYNIPVIYNTVDKTLKIKTILGINQKSNDVNDIPMQFQENYNPEKDNIELIFDI